MMRRCLSRCQAHRQLPTGKGNPILVVGVPSDMNSSYCLGPAQAPKLIRDAFACDSANTCAEDGLPLHMVPLDMNTGDISGSKLWDCGDLSLPPAASTEPVEGIPQGAPEAHNKISEFYSMVARQGWRPITLGGDHSVTYPVVQGLQSVWNHRLQIVHFDAHPDIYKDLMNNPYSHASPFHKLAEEKRFTWLQQWGIRTLNPHQKEQQAGYGNVTVIPMMEFHRMTPVERSQRLQFNSPVYVSVDLDVLDCSDCGGVSHFEPGGMTVRELLHCIQSIDAPSIVGGDVVEYNPARDVTGMSGMVAAKVFKELAALMLRTEGLRDE